MEIKDAAKYVCSKPLGNVFEIADSFFSCKPCLPFSLKNLDFDLTFGDQEVLGCSDGSDNFHMTSNLIVKDFSFSQIGTILHLREGCGVTFEGKEFKFSDDSLSLGSGLVLRTSDDTNAAPESIKHVKTNAAHDLYYLSSSSNLADDVSLRFVPDGLQLSFENENLNFKGRWGGGVVDGVSSGLYRNRTVSLNIFGNWKNGDTESCCVTSAKAPYTFVAVASREASALLVNGMAFTAFPFPVESGLLSENCSEKVKRALKKEACDLASSLMRRRLLIAKDVVETHIRKGYSAKIISFFCRFGRAIVEEIVKIVREKEKHTAALSKTLSSLLEKNEVEKAICDRLESDAQITKGHQPPELSISDLEQKSSELKTTLEDLSTRQINLKGLNTRLLKRVSEERGTQASRGTSVDEYDALTKRFEELCAAVAAEKSNVETINSSLSAAPSNSALDNVLKERHKVLLSELNDVRNRALSAGASSEATVGGTPHCKLRMKMAKSGIVHLQSEIDQLKLSVGSEESVQTATVLSPQQEGEAEVLLSSRLNDVMIELNLVKQEKDRLCDDINSINTRHIKSLKNIRDRTEKCKTQLNSKTAAGSINSLNTGILLQKEVSSLAEEVASVESEIGLLTRKTKDTLRRLKTLRDEMAGNDGKPSLAASELKAAVEAVKEENSLLEKEISGLEGVIDGCLERQREREKNLLSGRERDGDDRAVRLQKEVERRDEIINKLRADSQRSKQLEAKLLSLKASVGVNRQNSIQDAQLAAARTAAQTKADSALMFAKSSSSKILLKGL